MKPEGERLLADLASIPHVRIESHVPTLAEIEAWDLGSGESQVLALAAAAAEVGLWSTTSRLGAVVSRSAYR